MADLFDISEGRLLKQKGMEAAEFSYQASEWLERARSVAELLVAKRGEVTSDDVLRVCPRPPEVSFNATGSLFRGKKWKSIGWTNTAQTQGHCRAIRRWVLVQMQ
jgi:hypothetical protein